MVAAVFFDFDGTLADTAPDMVAALNAHLSAQSIPPVDLQEARLHCSGGARALLSIRDHLTGSMATARDDYLQHYEKTEYQQTTLFAGVEELLAGLVGASIKWGVVTNKPRRYFMPIAKRLSLLERGACVLIAGDDFPQAKPHPMSLLAAAERCQLAPEDCLYVGDDIRDGKAAAAAGMPFAGVTWGYWQQSQWQDEAVPIVLLLSTPDVLQPSLAALAMDND